MRIWERDPRQRSLTTIYVPQEPRPLMPTELAEEIVLTHPAQPPASSFHQVIMADEAGAAGGISLLGREPAEDHYFWIHSISVGHTDAVTSRDLTLGIQNIGAVVSVVVAFQAALVIGRSLFPGRAFLIPRGHRFVLSASGMAAAANLFMRYLYLDLLAAEVSPPL